MDTENEINTVNKEEDIITKLLLKYNYLIYRHLLLSVIITIITINFVWDVREDFITLKIKFLLWLTYQIVFYIAIYFNIYFAVPKFLLKNKIGFYFIIFFIMTILSIISIVSGISFSVGANNVKLSGIKEGKMFISSLVNISSSIISIGLLYAGTTTFVLFKHWNNRKQEMDELEESNLQSELESLKNQIKPHFLFNMLNNANVLINKNGEEAAKVIFKLEDFLRYQINENSKKEVFLKEDIDFLNDFLNLENIRRDKFEFKIFKNGNLEDIKIPPLLFISFVENAVKHNFDNNNTAYVHLYFNKKENKLKFKCENSKPEQKIRNNKGNGLGLKNIKRRLDLLFPDNYTLEIEDEKEKYAVNLSITL